MGKRVKLNLNIPNNKIDRHARDVGNLDDDGHEREFFSSSYLKRFFFS